MFFFSFLLISDIPLVKVENTFYAAAEGASLEVECKIESKPRYNYIFWTKSVNGSNTVLIPGSVGFEGMTIDRPNLVIPIVDMSMHANYTCYAINALGTGESSSILLNGKNIQVMLDIE